MTTNEFKKILYKEKPIGIRTKKDNGYSYGANTSAGYIDIFVPFKEMGTTAFESEMPMQLLIRWLK